MIESNDKEAALIIAERAAVVGAGFMGSRIAFICAQQGIRTINIDISTEQLDKARSGVERILSKLVVKEKISVKEREEITSLLSYSCEIASAGEADFVIEAAPEDLGLKKSILRQIETNCKREAIILSNTSGLSITEIAKDAIHPERIMCAHFFAPPNIMRLVELIRGEKTSDITYQKTLEFSQQLGKQAVNAPELPGFIVNRLLIPMINDAAFLHSQGAGKAEIDSAMKLGANHRMGPLELGDYIGLDVVLAIMQTLHEGFGDDKYRPCPLIEQLVAENKLGRKTKQGFYSY